MSAAVAGSTARTGRATTSARWRTRTRKLLVPVGLLVVWVAVTSADLVASLYLPSPQDLWNAFDGMRGELPRSLASSVGMTLAGFAVGTSLGALLGLLMAYSRVMRELFGSVLDFIRPVPVFALIPLFVVWFGIGRGPQITLIALGTSVVLGVTTLSAIRNVSPVHVKAALTLGATRWDAYRTVIVPSVLPHLLGAIRVAAAASWGLDVAAEFLGAQTGLGYLMINRQQYLDTAGILLVVLIYSALAMILDLLIQLAERPLTRWTERNATGGPVAGLLGVD